MIDTTREYAFDEFELERAIAFECSHLLYDTRYPSVSLNDWLRFSERRGDQKDSWIYLLYPIRSPWFCKSAAIAISAASENGNRISDWYFLTEVSDSMRLCNFQFIYPHYITLYNDESFRKHPPLKVKYATAYSRTHILIMGWDLFAEYHNEFSRYEFTRVTWIEIVTSTKTSAW